MPDQPVSCIRPGALPKSLDQLSHRKNKQPHVWDIGLYTSKAVNGLVHIDAWHSLHVHFYSIFPLEQYYSQFQNNYLADNTAKVLRPQILKSAINIMQSVWSVGEGQLSWMLPKTMEPAGGWDTCERWMCPLFGTLAQIPGRLLYLGNWSLPNTA